MLIKQSNQLLLAAYCVVLDKGHAVSLFIPPVSAELTGWLFTCEPVETIVSFYCGECDFYQWVMVHALFFPTLCTWCTWNDLAQRCGRKSLWALFRPRMRLLFCRWLAGSWSALRYEKPHPRHRLLNSSLLNQKSFFCLRRVWLRVTSVSYTHLRAHET